jgi:hypothetical protein
MFSTNEVLAAVKRSDIACDTGDSASHCQLVEARSKKLGFESYHHLRTWLVSAPSRDIGDYCLALMKRICELRLPSQSCGYFEFMILPGSAVGYYSYWIGWDRRGNEVRVPRPLVGRETTIRLRNLGNSPIFVIESAKELAVWRHTWFSTALIPEKLAREHFPLEFNKQMLVDADPPYEKIRANSPYDSNIAAA